MVNAISLKREEGVLFQTPPVGHAFLLYLVLTEERLQVFQKFATRLAIFSKWLFNDNTVHTLAVRSKGQFVALSRHIQKHRRRQSHIKDTILLPRFHSPFVFRFRYHLVQFFEGLILIVLTGQIGTQFGEPIDRFLVFVFSDMLDDSFQKGVVVQLRACVPEDAR